MQTNLEESSIKQLGPRCAKKWRRYACNLCRASLPQHCQKSSSISITTSNTFANVFRHKALDAFRGTRDFVHTAFLPIFMVFVPESLVFASHHVLRPRN